jgi:hypothetical protein
LKDKNKEIKIASQVNSPDWKNLRAWRYRFLEKLVVSIAGR